MVAVLGAQVSTLQHQYVVNIIAVPRLAVTILRQTRDLKVGLVIEPGVTQTLSTGKKDLHLELSGAGIVGKHVMAMTTFTPGAVGENNMIRVFLPPDTVISQQQ